MTKHSNNAAEVRRLKLAEILKIGETDPKAADAALQRMASESAAGHLPEIEGENDFLGDLEIGPEETIDIDKDLDELNAAYEAAPIDKINKDNVGPKSTKQDKGAETNDGEPLPELDEAVKKKGELRELMLAALDKIAGKTNEEKDDPLAIERMKVSNTLKKVRRTLADLPPDYWELPHISKIPFERSRINELHRIFNAGEEEMHEAKRVHELEKRGRPANYDLLSRSEKNRININARQHRHRDKIRASSKKLVVAPLPVAYVAGNDLSTALKKMSRNLENWAIAGSNGLARYLRKPERQQALIRAAKMYSRFFNQHNRLPTHEEFGKWLRLSKDQARRKLDLLKSLYGPGGPWASV